MRTDSVAPTGQYGRGGVAGGIVEHRDRGAAQVRGENAGQSPIEILRLVVRKQADGHLSGQGGPGRVPAMCRAASQVPNPPASPRAMARMRLPTRQEMMIRMLRTMPHTRHILPGACANWRPFMADGWPGKPVGCS